MYLNIEKKLMMELLKPYNLDKTQAQVIICIIREILHEVFRIHITSVMTCYE